MFHRCRRTGTSRDFFYDNCHLGHPVERPRTSIPSSTDPLHNLSRDLSWMQNKCFTIHIFIVSWWNFKRDHFYLLNQRNKSNLFTAHRQEVFYKIYTRPVRPIATIWWDFSSIHNEIADFCNVGLWFYTAMAVMLDCDGCDITLCTAFISLIPGTLRWYVQARVVAYWAILFVVFGGASWNISYV